ncbi:flagellar brake protein [Bacillus tuaregi]|uniref:flagellar brake protein n=1 Tax=Bacillus tuaregi TaxID=1816695 RepID=UPI0008F8D3AD|nr:flagellar brake domain-containing protein [Bacillus tuaregi]
MLTIGNSLILEPKYSDRMETFKCRLVERKGNILYIDYPINVQTNRTTFLVDGTQLRVSFVEGKSGYLFETEILGRMVQGIPMMLLQYPGDDYVIKVQRREFVRIETSVDVAIHPLNSEFYPFTTITEDISAGGALVVFNHAANIMPGMNIRSVFVLPMQNGDIHYMDLHSKVVRVMKKKGTNQDLFSILFQDVTPFERQQLLRFTFDRQLALKKKGLELSE